MQNSTAAAPISTISTCFASTTKRTSMQSARLPATSCASTAIATISTAIATANAAATTDAIPSGLQQLRRI